MTETIEQRIARLEANGYLDPNCKGCRAAYEWYRANPTDPGPPFMPHHQASSRCESGKYPHCTCPVCWG